MHMILDYSGGPYEITRVLMRVKLAGRSQKDVEASLGGLHFEAGGRGREPRNVVASGSWTKQGNRGPQK